MGVLGDGEKSRCCLRGGESHKEESNNLSDVRREGEEEGVAKLMSQSCGGKEIVTMCWKHFLLYTVAASCTCTYMYNINENTKHATTSDRKTCTYMYTFLSMLHVHVLKTLWLSNRHYVGCHDISIY